MDKIIEFVKTNKKKIAVAAVVVIAVIALAVNCM